MKIPIDPAKDPAARDVTQDNAVKSALQTIARYVGIYLAVLIVLGGGIGYLVAGMEGVWGAALGVGIAAFFALVTLFIVIWTANKPMIATSGGIMGSWILKVLVLFVVLVIVKDQDFYHKGVFFVMIVAAIVGILVIESMGVLRARIPATAPPPRELS